MAGEVIGSVNGQIVVFPSYDAYRQAGAQSLTPAQVQQYNQTAAQSWKDMGSPTCSTGTNAAVLAATQASLQQKAAATAAASKTEALYPDYSNINTRKGQALDYTPLKYSYAETVSYQGRDGRVDIPKAIADAYGSGPGNKYYWAARQFVESKTGLTRQTGDQSATGNTQNPETGLWSRSSAPAPQPQIIKADVVTKDGRVTTVTLPTQLSDIRAASVGTKAAVSETSYQPIKDGVFQKLYIPEGSYIQQELSNIKLGGSESGELAFYRSLGKNESGAQRMSVNPDTGKLEPYILFGGGSRAAAQSGMFTTAAASPAVFAEGRVAQRELITPAVAVPAVARSGLSGATVAALAKEGRAGDVLSKLGSEAYGGIVTLQDNRTLGNIRYEDVGNRAAWNLASYFDPMAVNKGKAELPGAKIPWSVPENAPAFFSMDKTGADLSKGRTVRSFDAVLSPDFKKTIGGGDRLVGSKTVASVGTTTFKDSEATAKAPFVSARYAPLAAPKTVPNEYVPFGLLGLGGLLPKIPSKDQLSAYLTDWAARTKANPIDAMFGMQAKMAAPVVSTLGGVTSRLTFGLSEFAYKPTPITVTKGGTTKTYASEWDRFVEGSGRVARYTTGLTEAKQGAYFETIKNAPGLAGEAKRGLFYVGTEVINKPAELAPAAILGAATGGAARMVPGFLAKVGAGSGTMAASAKFLQTPGGASLAKAGLLGLFGGAYVYGVTDRLKATPEKTKENIYRSTPALAAMYAGAGGLNWLGETKVVSGMSTPAGATFKGLQIRDAYFGGGRTPTGQRYAGAFSPTESYAFVGKAPVAAVKRAPLGLPDLSAKKYTDAGLGGGWEKPPQLPPGREPVSFKSSAPKAAKYSPGGMTYDIESLTKTRLKPEYEFRPNYMERSTRKPFGYAPSFEPEPLAAPMMETKVSMKRSYAPAPERKPLIINIENEFALSTRKTQRQPVPQMQMQMQTAPKRDTRPYAPAPTYPYTLIELGYALSRRERDAEIVPYEPPPPPPSTKTKASPLSTGTKPGTVVIPLVGAGILPSSWITPSRTVEPSVRPEPRPKPVPDPFKYPQPEPRPRPTTRPTPVTPPYRPPVLPPYKPTTAIPPLTLPGFGGGGSAYASRKGHRRFQEIFLPRFGQLPIRVLPGRAVRKAGRKPRRKR